MSKNDKSINCQEATEKLLDWLNESLPAAERSNIDAHLAQCPGCGLELMATRQLWQRLATVPVPEPHPEMSSRFYAMLGEFENEEKAVSQSTGEPWWAWLQNGWSPEKRLRLAYSVLLLAIGVTAGYWFPSRKTADVAYQQHIDTLSTQVQEMREMMMLSLLENPSATERLRAVSFTKDINDVDGRVIDALLMTLNNDANVNVRLVTLEALVQLADDARVREGLVQSLMQQESPLVQVELADVMVKLQEKRSLKPMRQLLQKPGTNDLVKSKLQQTIKQLS